jgi:ribonuclease-3 family protein
MVLPNGLALAYIGDGYYELAIRTYLLTKRLTKVNDLHHQAIRFTSAKGQAFVMSELLKDQLTDDEITYFKRGRNEKTNRKPKNTDLATYHLATGFESLLGSLYLLNETNRLDEIIRMAIQIIEKNEIDDVDLRE